MNRLRAYRPSYWTIWAALIYTTLRYLAFAKANSTFGDSTGYRESSHFPFFSERFLAGRRSFPVPLFWKIVHGGDTAIVSAQLVFSIACWWFVATTIASFITNRWLRLATFWFVLLFSLTTPIVQWDRNLLSESVTLSLTALLFALALRAVARPTNGTVAAALVVGGLWMFARDSDSAAALLVVPVLLVVFARTRTRLALVAAGVVALIFVADTVSAQVGHRADTSLVTVVSTRLFVDEPSARGWMTSHGYTDPGAPNTISVYRSYLLHHPVFTLAGPLENRPSYSDGPVSPDRLTALYAPRTIYEKSTPRWRLPAAVQHVLSPARPAVVGLWLLLAGIACAAAWRLGGFDRRWIVPLVVLAATYPQFVVIWNGDEHEVDRHAYVAATELRLALIALFAFSVDRLLTVRRPASA